MTATVVFGWLMSGRYFWSLAWVTGVDWFLINLLNRVTDIAEDTRNGIVGTERVARRARVLTVGCFVLMAVTFGVTHRVWPALTPWRVAVQCIGLGYNYKIVPTLSGLSRFKEMYFFKNFGSSVLFVLTGFVYPWVVGHGAHTLTWMGVATLAVFFVLFELTYEILYDLRDLEGDRAEGVPTYPVVHGPERARQIVDGLLVTSALVILGGFLYGTLGVREGLMVAAPGVQYKFYRPRYDRGLTSWDCIALTHLATVLLWFFLLGTFLWLRAGMPANIVLRTP
jgi:4-hydroxybenzoate polyprenyltransferase